MIEIECLNCNVLFFKKKAEIRRTKKNFCSKSCSGEYRSKENARGFYRKTVTRANGCIEWMGHRNKDGYGVARFFGEVVLAHRASWFLHKGILSDETQVLHACDNPCCVNSDHLFLGDHIENMIDMTVKGRRFRKVTEEIADQIKKSALKSNELAVQLGLSERTIRSYRSGAKNV